MKAKHSSIAAGMKPKGSLRIVDPVVIDALEAASRLPLPDMMQAAAEILPPSFCKRLEELLDKAQPRHAQRTAKLDRRDGAIRDLAMRFYSDLSTISERAVAIAAHLARQASMKGKSTEPIALELRKILEINEGKTLSKRQIYNILNGVRSNTPLQ